VESGSWERDSGGGGGGGGGKVCRHFEEEKKEDSFRLRSSPFLVLAPDLVLVSCLMGTCTGCWP